MPSCAFINCLNRTNRAKSYNKDRGITFHAFPINEMEKEKWVQVLRKHRKEPSWECNVYTRICSVHFKPEDMYYTQKGFRKINKGAIPVFRIPNNESSPRPGTPNSLQEEEANISDLEPIHDAPVIGFLKKKIEKLTEENQTLRYDNKYLKRRIVRLTKKTETLNEAIANYKKYKNIDDKVIEISKSEDEESNSLCDEPSSLVEAVLT